MFNPLARILLGLIGLLAALIGMYQIGRTDGINATQRKAEAAQAASLRRAFAQAEEVARRDAEILNTHTAREASTRIVYRTLNQEANRYALNHRDDPCGLDADGLRLWTAANAGTLIAAPAATQPDAALPGTGAARIGRVGGVAGESHRRGAGVPDLPGTPAGAGGVGEISPGAAQLNNLES